MARAFDGSNQHLEVADDPIVDVGSGDFTISLWQRSGTEGAGAMALFGKRDGSLLFNARWRNAQNEIRWQVNDGGGNEEVDYESTEMFDGVWHHWLFEREAGVALRVYVDGSQVASSASTSGNLDNDGSLWIAARGGTSGASSDYWGGEIAEFALFKRMLSQDEIDALQLTTPSFLRPLPELHLSLMGRQSPEPDGVGGLTAVLINSPTFIPHPEAVQQLGRAWHALPAPPVPLAGVVAGQSSIQGSLVATVVVAGSIAGQSSIAGQLPLQLSLRGVSAGQSSIAGNLTATVSLAGAVGAQSSVQGSLAATVPLAAVVAGQSALAASLTNTVFIAGTVDGQSGVAGSLSATVPVAGAIDGQSSVVGDLAVAVPLAGLIAAQSSVAGDLTAAVPFAGVVDGQSSLTGDLTKIVLIAGVIDGQSGLTGQLSATVPVAGVVAGQSSVFGDLQSTVPLSGLVTGQSALAGELGATIILAGSIDGQSSVAGAIDRRRGVAALVVGQSSLAGDLTAGVALQGVVAGQSSVVGDIDLALSLRGVINGQSQPSARLRILGEILTTAAGGLVIGNPISGKAKAKATTGGSLTVLRKT